jgi:hypothetical protein
VTLLYAIGVGAIANVLIATIGRLLRFVGVRFDPSGEWIVVGVAAAVVAFSLGTAIRPQILRLALLGVAVHAALVLNRLLGIVVNGRAPDGSIDAFSATPLALALIVGGLVVGVAAGLILRGFQPRIPFRPPDHLVRAAGFAYVAATIVGAVWPAPFFAQLLGDTDLATALVSLPLILAGPLAGGAYAAIAGADYRAVSLLGAYMTLPIIVTLIAGTIGNVLRLTDPRFESVAGLLRGGIILSWFLVGIRLAGWPLGAAFAQGFLTSETHATRREPAP